MSSTACPTPTTRVVISRLQRTRSDIPPRTDRVARALALSHRLLEPLER